LVVSWPTLRPFGIDGFIPGAWVEDFLVEHEHWQFHNKEREIKERYAGNKVCDLQQKYGTDP
jgi:hypothetical protein